MKGPNNLPDQGDDISPVGRAVLEPYPFLAEQQKGPKPFGDVLKKEIPIVEDRTFQILPGRRISASSLFFHNMKDRGPRIIDDLKTVLPDLQGIVHFFP